MTGRPPQARLNRKQKGAVAEQAAVHYLLSRGYRIVARNWRCRSGELDIVAEREDTLVFVEVRSRSGHGAQGTPEESVDMRKIRQVRATAEVYIHQAGSAGRIVSFDVIAVQLGEKAEVVSLNHIRGAF